MIHELDMPGRVIIGADARNRTAQEAKDLGWSRVLIVSDPFHEQAGRIRELQSLLTEADVESVVYTGVTGEPDTAMVERGLEQFRNSECDGIIALGGGSVIDTAKTISVMPKNRGTVQDLMGVNNVRRPGVGLIALPTTAGTGSEATRVVVIADTEAQVKMTGRSRHYVPDVAILDYKLTMSMPKSLTGEVGVDALTHAIEAFVSRQANETTGRFALVAAKLIWNSITKACNDSSDEDARRDMLAGSFYAGIAFSNASVGLVHSMSEPLGACFHVPHGLSNAMLLPAVTQFSASGAPSRYAEIARSMELADESISDQECCRRLIDGLFELNQRLAIASPKSMGITRDSYNKQVEKMTQDALAAGSTANNPVIPTGDQIKEMYRAVYGD